MKEGGSESQTRSGSRVYDDLSPLSVVRSCYAFKRQFFKRNNMDRYAFSFTKPEVPKFVVGNLNITPNAKASLSHEEVLAALKRHMLGDWGDMEPDDIAANNTALQDGGRLFSAYTSTLGTRFWIITEDDHAHTTILLPEDY